MMVERATVRDAQAVEDLLVAFLAALVQIVECLGDERAGSIVVIPSEMLSLTASKKTMERSK